MLICPGMDKRQGKPEALYNASGAGGSSWWAVSAGTIICALLLGGGGYGLHKYCAPDSIAACLFEPRSAFHFSNLPASEKAQSCYAPRSLLPGGGFRRAVLNLFGGRYEDDASALLQADCEEFLDGYGGEQASFPKASWYERLKDAAVSKLRCGPADHTWACAAKSWTSR